MDRTSRLLRFANLDGVGLEIGPLDTPLVARDGSRRIFYADYAPRELLQLKSRNDPHRNCDAIPEIDFVIHNTAAYSAISERFDYIIASHVIEHTPDFIGWLNALLGLLKPEGRLILAVPDRRHMFDYFRAESTFGEVLEAYLERRERPSVRQVFDGTRGARQVDTIASWVSAPPADTPAYFSAEVAFALAKDSFENKTYSDCHCWVFTFESFLDLLITARRFEICRAVVIEATPPVLHSHEFHIVLSNPHSSSH